ncbi:MAG: hypothetical protein Q4G60_11645 [bacterium]|nr:hypothetical protein [bacterium]
MNLNNRLGKIGSLITAITVFLFAICMITSFDFGGYFVCIFLSLGFIMMIAAFEAECNENTRVAGKIASVFAGIYAVLIMIVYFTQCTTIMNDNLSNEAMKILNYKYMGMLFNLDLLGYGIMALATFFIGLTIEVRNKKDKALKALLLIHGIFFISCLIMPMTGVFVYSAEETSIGGVIALEFWCLYFLPIGILSYLHFKDTK